jgi:hypothetical protein
MHTWLNASSFVLSSSLSKACVLSIIADCAAVCCVCFRKLPGSKVFCYFEFASSSWPCVLAGIAGAPFRASMVDLVAQYYMTNTINWSLMLG